MKEFIKKCFVVFVFFSLFMCFFVPRYIVFDENHKMDTFSGKVYLKSEDPWR